MKSTRTKRKLAFTTATAIGILLAGNASYAGSGNTAKIVQNQSTNSGVVDQSGGDDNYTSFTQNGDDNSTKITQSGSNNNAGNHPVVTDTYGVIYQDGNSNTLTIQQDNGDHVADGNAGAGSMLQTGSYNWASISQTGTLDEVIGATQTSATTAAALANKLTVVQSNAPNNFYSDVVHDSSDYDYGNQYIGSVVQNNNGDPANTVNTLTLTQTLGVYGAGDQIVSVVQDGSGNIGSVTQNGRRNYLASLSQTGAGNTSTIVLQGDGNGSNGAASPVAGTFSSAAASGVGISQGVVSQTGGDTANYNATGNLNLYGFVQMGGTSNSIVGTVNGSSNEAAVKQNGNGNVISFTQSGDDNALGVSLTGNDNGVGLFTAGSAAALLDAGSALLAEGSASQDSSGGGGGNKLTYTVYGSGNLYAFAQKGGNNTITGTVGDPVNYSAGNQVAVLQVGNNNTTTFTQKGTGTNTASITQ